MKKQKSTKRALLLSALSLLMCVSMLIGSTFAWFTDSVTSGNNKIIAGNLDVELYYQNDETSDWTKIEKDSNIFKVGALWEPGHTEVIKLKVVNEGSLALKYQFAISVLTETMGINQNNAIFRLSDYIYFNLLDKELADDISRADAVAEAENGSKKLSSKHTKSNELLSKQEDVVTLVVYMPESVGNDANYKTGTAAPEIKLGLDVFATQYTHESDSFGSDYDKDAYWTGDTNTEWYNTTDKEFTLITAEQLAGLAEIVNAGTDSFVNKTIKLGANIDLNNMDWTPIGTAEHPFMGTFIGTGYTISKLYVTGTAGVGLFGHTFTGAHIEGVTVNKAYVSGNDYVGTILGKGYLAANCLKDCKVSDAIVIATPFQREDGQYDGGAKAGVIAGYALNGNVTGNKAYNSSVTAYRDLGGIVGMLAGDGIGSRTLDASGNEVNNVKLNFVGVAGAYYENKVNGNMDAVVGRVGASTQVGENKVVDVEMNNANENVYMIFTLQDLLTFANEVNNGNTYAGKTVLLGDNIDLNNMEWTPIGTGAGFKGIFDGNGKTISNLKITGNDSTVGFFGNTYDGEIKNLTIENASVSGYLNVGVVAGNPYTSKYTNITVKGHVEVNGFAYVGGVGGKNAYADWTGITVAVDDTSYVKAVSSENGKHYRTYVGGVIGFMGEGGHTVQNVTSNIDVIGDVCDIGGIVGIAHYGNNFKNITCTGDVTGTFFDPECPEDADEIGGIAGVWHNQSGYTVTFIDCEFTGKLTAADASVDVSNNTITGKAYSASGTGELVIVNYVDVDGITYVNDGVTGESTLYRVPADYEGTVVEVAEGTDTIGGYAFAYNQNIEKIVLPKSVTTLNDRAFRDTSASTVILNEGLTNISYQAFRNALNVTSVEIPSTVTTISKEAFQNSGVTELVIPSNVTTIEYGGLRDMKMLEKVTIEGNVEIPVYAFRACTNLKTVILKGNDVTFSARGMIFTNKENGDGSAITVTVANKTIKDRLIAADTAATDYGGYTIICEQEVQDGGYYTDTEGNAYAYDTGALKAAIDDGVKDITLSSGEYQLDKAVVGVTIKGADEKTTLLNAQVPIYGFTGKIYQRMHFENLTFTNTISTFQDTATEETGGNSSTFTNVTFAAGFRHGYGSSVVFTDCTFGSNYENYALHFEYDEVGTAGEIKLSGCKFEGGNVHLGGPRTYAFTNCEFKANTDFQVWTGVTLDGCTVGGVEVTEANVATLFPNLDLKQVTIK